MKVAVLGASGRAGSAITRELAQRGHLVTAIARSPDRIPQADGVTALAGDVTDPETVAPLLSGADAVVSAIMFVDSDPEMLIGLVKKAGVARYLVVGGASSLEVAPGVKLIDAPGFPDAYRAEATAGGLFLDRLRQEGDLYWTYLSPSAVFDGQERTGQFRLGQDALLSDATGDSRISFPDYAIAMVDEIETPRHSRQRFTVGY